VMLIGSPLVREYLGGSAVGATMQNLNQSILLSLSIGMPPFCEQRRIVAKVDELMALCDGLAAAQTERESQRHRLAKTALHHLRNSANRDDIRAQVHFYFSHFSELTAYPEQISSLREAILDLAVRGRLVQQNSSEEPASELLKRIHAEKSRRIAEGTLRREKPLPFITEAEVPFAIPRNWSWARIGDCSLLTEYGTSVKSDRIANGVPVLAMGDIQGGQVSLSTWKKVPAQIEDLPQLFLKQFDLLYNRTNSAELVGKTGIFMGEDDVFTFASYLIRIRFLNDLTSSVYTNIAMNAPYFRPTQIVPELRQQCGQANVNGSKLRNMLIPLPPLAEQQRIVTKVKDLMSVCDQLEAQLNIAQEESRRLLEATLLEALGESPKSPGSRIIESGIVESPCATAERALQ
jgi:type I restriction enzyme, S subunit